MSTTQSSDPSSMKRLAAAFCTVLLIASSFFSAPAVAQTNNTEGTMSDLQKRIEETGEAYTAAKQKVATIHEEMKANNERIAQINAQLPNARQNAASAISNSYKMRVSGPSLINLVFSSNDFNELLTTIKYLNAIETHNSGQAKQLTDLAGDLKNTQNELTKQAQEAAAEEQAASDALAAAQAGREEAQKQVIAENGNSGGSSLNPIDWNTDKVNFVASWAPRIDKYRAGSPMAGCGTASAAAAWDYGVDPRWSPAISNTESSKGAYCFKPHNAWGWGNSSWPDWKSAITDHVRGLATRYGSTITMVAARKYCPSNAEHWYKATLEQMNMI